jgi:hypothetical protein
VCPLYAGTWAELTFTKTFLRLGLPKNDKKVRRRKRGEKKKEESWKIYDII